ncbi:MAG TPA: hypothetical protein PKH07_17490, partial [bacterium]|nr:hypothetical protein [bacterium]
PFGGTALGGQLLLVNSSGSSPLFVAIPTFEGEGASEVLERLCSMVNEKDPFGWFEGSHFSGAPPYLEPVDGGLSLTGFLGEYFLAGTELGLNIPKPPTSVSAVYDPHSNCVSVMWDNPSGDKPYDGVSLIINGSVMTVPRPVSRYDIDLNVSRSDPSAFSIWVVGLVRDASSGAGGILNEDGSGCLYVGIPSGAGGIMLRNNTQEEIADLPFVGGVAPNWTDWGNGDVILEEGTKSTHYDDAIRRPPPRIKKPEDKTRFQMLRSDSSGAVGGAYRRFLGLTPGHTYRLTMRLSTLKAAETGDCALSAHAIADSSKSALLSFAQMEGSESLPDGREGQKAARFALLNRQHLTNGVWTEVGTAVTPKDAELETRDITLPESGDCIFVWLRLAGSCPTGVGMDWIKLEDISETQTP